MTVALTESRLKTYASFIKLEHDIRSSGKQVQIHIYPGVDHAFFNDSRPEVYRADDARLAWERTLQFLGEHLRYSTA